MELSTTNKLHTIEETLQRLTKAIVSIQESIGSTRAPRVNLPCPAYEEATIDDVGRAPFFPKLSTLDFPTFVGGDLIEWLS